MEEPKLSDSGGCLATNQRMLQRLVDAIGGIAAGLIVFTVQDSHGNELNIIHPQERNVKPIKVFPIDPSD